MLTRRFVLTACLGLVPAAPALAQALVGEPVVPPRADDDDDDDGIARRSGVVDVENIRRRRGVWIVSGTDEDDEDIRVVINNEGDVVDVRRD